MTRDEIRGLIGGYAMGSLGADERKALFEAALEDQELFDELAREQALKELLDEPGVKPRLLAALTSKQKSWWMGTWVWAAAGAFAVAVIAGIALYKTPSPPQELARVIAPAVPAPPQPTFSAPGAPAPVVPRTMVPTPSAAAPMILTPSAPVSSPAASSVPPLDAPKQVAPIVQTRAPKVGTGPQPASAAASAIAVPESAPVLPPVPQADSSASTGAPGAVSGAIPAGRGGGGGRGGAANRALARAPAVIAPVRFAFDYSVTPEGVLRFTPTAPGFLTVSVNSATASTQLFSGRAVQAGSTTEVTLPADAVLANLTFSAQSEADAVSVGTLGGNGFGGAMDPPSGTKSDPNPSPNSRLTVLIPVKQQR